MKKILLLFLLLFWNNASFAKSGFGELTLNDGRVEAFIAYIKGDKRNKDYGTGMDKGEPIIFAVTKSGDFSFHYYCPTKYKTKYGGCVHPNKIVGDVLRECKKISRERGTGERCYIFAKKYNIVWNKMSYSFEKSMSEDEIKSALTELGFYGESNEESKPKLIKKTKKKSKKKNKSIIEQIKELNELYETGILSKEEFEKAKKKILN